MIDWNGPSTPELTDLIKESGFFIKNSKQTVTDFIYQNLIEKEYLKEELNFEIIINVIEELIIYYSEYNRDLQTPSILRSFIENEQLDKIFDFAIDGGKRNHGYKLQIPEGKDYPFSNFAYKKENPNEFYLKHLISEIITDICARVSEYSYHTKGNSVIDLQSELSKDFVKWISSIERNNNIRLYTLNYDRIFKILLKENNIDCFEGFYPTEEVSDMQGLRCDVPRILEDVHSNIYYNLHGSAFWRVLATNHNQIDGPEIVYTGIPELSMNEEIAEIQIEKGKPVYLTNIITGYQKAQKSMISPFKQMNSSFDRDCFRTDKIYIIGYSFSDEHINQSLKNALRYNKGLQLEIVDPNFIENQMDHKLSLTLFQYIENDFLKPKKIEDNIFCYFENRIKVYTLKFYEYLRLKSSR